MGCPAGHLKLPWGRGSLSSAALGPQPYTTPPQLGIPHTGRCSCMSLRWAAPCGRRLPPPAAPARPSDRHRPPKGQPRACPVPMSQIDSHLSRGWSSVPHPLLQEATSHATLCQQHLCPWGCGPRRFSFQTPQSFLLAEIAGSEHKHRHLSLLPHVSHQPGMVSSPSIHHTRFLPLSGGEHSVSPSPSAWPRGQAALPGGRRGRSSATLS